MTLLDRLEQLDHWHQRLKSAAERAPDDRKLLAHMASIVAEKALAVMQECNGVKVETTVCGINVTGGE